VSLPAAVYRPRNPQLSDYYHCVEDYFETFVGIYDEHFSRQYGFWRPYLENVIYRYLDCGDPHNGFAGFNVFCGNRISPKDDTAMEHLACCIIRASFSQERMQYLDQEGKGIYMAKDGKKTKIFPAWNGWPPCARIFRTGESGWCVITDTTATSRGENGRRKAALRLSPAFSNRREMKKPSGGTGRD
jgi:hypothetical protein